MASKYDRFWQERLAELRKELGQAAMGKVAGLDVAVIKKLGRRASWHGSTRVRDGEFLAGNMAHAVSLGRQLLQSGMLTAWPRTEFLLSISDGGRLTVEARALAARTATSVPGAEERDAARSPLQDPDAGIINPSEACRRIHEVLKTLPEYRQPSEVPFANGLYFFYEQGEKNEHGTTGRVVRIGSHPRSENRLVGRLSEHFRTAANAKNGSVFRRYVGGALIRQSDPRSTCLGPEPGKGHWEHQNLTECPRCGPVEEEVSAYLSERAYFRCVRVDDIDLRKRLEKALIATVAQCPVCRPSDTWLGKYAYAGQVWSTGLWNAQHTGDRPTSDEDLRHFDALAQESRDVATPRQRSIQARADLSDTLLVVPCSGGKKGASVLDLPLRRVADYLDPAAVQLLEEGRDQAFARKGVSIDHRSPLRPAIAMYSGQPFSTRCFRSLLLEALDENLHCLIVSGGYGLVRPEEPVHEYKAHMPTQTRGVWAQRLARLLPAYIKQTGIRRAFVAVSRSYASCLPEGFAETEWWGVPEFNPKDGSAIRVVPAKVGDLIVRLLSNGMEPGAEWRQAG